MAKWIIAECSKDRMGMFELFWLSIDIEKLNGKCMIIEFSYEWKCAWVDCE